MAASNRDAAAFQAFEVSSSVASTELVVGDYAESFLKCLAEFDELCIHEGSERSRRLFGGPRISERTTASRKPPCDWRSSRMRGDCFGTSGGGGLAILWGNRTCDAPPSAALLARAPQLAFSRAEEAAVAPAGLARVEAREQDARPFLARFSSARPSGSISAQLFWDDWRWSLLR